MSNHTPGEWTVSKNLAGDLVVTSTNHHDNDGYIICQTFGRHKYGNAVLIAAAPKLLVALRNLIGCAEPHRDRAEIKAARAAIAEATDKAPEEVTEDKT